MKALNISKVIILLISIISTGILKAQGVAFIVAPKESSVNESTPGRKFLSLIKVGTGASYLDVHNYSPNFRFHIGLSPTISLSSYLYIKPEIAISLKGGYVSYDDTFFNGNVSYRMGYLEFPLVLGLKPTQWLAFEFGGYGGLLLTSNFDFNGTFFYGYGSFGYDEVNFYDYGIVNGITFIGKKGEINIRYYHGLQKLAANSTAEVFLGNATNHTIQVTFKRKVNYSKIFSNHFNTISDD